MITLVRLMQVSGISMALAMAPVRQAHADDGWGCKVLLCVANPAGPEALSQCVPPIEKLWDALRHGQPFPTCVFGTIADLGAEWLEDMPQGMSSLGAGTGASHTWAGPNYCRKDLIGWGGHEQSDLVCHASGAINVTIGGQLYTRVWWGVNQAIAPSAASTSGTSTVTEYYGGASPYPSYDPTLAGVEFMKEWRRRTTGDDGTGNIGDVFGGKH